MNEEKTRTITIEVAIKMPVESTIEEALKLIEGAIAGVYSEYEVFLRDVNYCTDGDRVKADGAVN